MGTPVRFAHNMLHGETSHLQCVGDERPVTAPWYRFGTHQADSFAPRKVDQLIQIFVKFLRLHVIREPSETGIAPSRVGRIALSMAKSSKPGHMLISNSNGS